MGRHENPLPDGPLREFAEQMRALRAAAGNPTHRELSRRANYSPSALAAACSGQLLPSLEVTLAYVRACGADEEQGRAAWQQAANRSRATDTAPAPPPPLHAGTAPAGSQPPEPATDAARRAVRPRTVLTVALAVLILAGATASLLINRNDIAGRTGSTPVAHRPARPDVPAPTGAAAYTYGRTAGAGCTQTPDTQVFEDEPRPATHPWTAATGVNWSAAGCSDTLLYSMPTTKQGSDEWINDYGWQFAHVPPGAACTFHIYIADSPYSQSTASYFWTTGGADMLDSQAFTIDQAIFQGDWVDHGPLRFPTGQAMLEVTDSRTGGPPAPMTAAVVRLTCA